MDSKSLLSSMKSSERKNRKKGSRNRVRERRGQIIQEEMDMLEMKVKVVEKPGQKLVDVMKMNDEH